MASRALAKYRSSRLVGARAVPCTDKTAAILCDQKPHVKWHDRIFRVKKETPRPIVLEFHWIFRYGVADLTAAFPTARTSAFTVADQGQLFQQKVIVQLRI